MFKLTARRGAFATLLVAGSLGLGAGVADAAVVHYQLTPKEQRTACGSFGGTIIFGDGSSLDCHSGVATLPSAE